MHMMLLEYVPLTQERLFKLDLGEGPMTALYLSTIFQWHRKRGGGGREACIRPPNHRGGGAEHVWASPEICQDPII